MSSFVVVALTITTAFAMSAAAAAQYALPTISGALKVTPAKAGTPAKPKNGFVSFAFDVADAAPATLSRVEYTIPRGVRLATKGFPTCAVESLATAGDAACPQRSLVGTGTATASTGPASLEVYVDGPGTLALYPVGSLLAPIRARIAGRRLAFDVPAQAKLTAATLNLGRQPSTSASATTGKGPRRRTRFFASVVGCSGANHTGSIRALQAGNPSTPFDTGAISSSCTAAPKK